MLATSAHFPHGAVHQRLEIDTVQVQVLDATLLGETKVVRLDVAEMDGGLEGDVQLLKQVENVQGQARPLGPARETGPF